jgi:polysaccharide deacetylase 2 family uncharacterized protein YibQ
MAKKSTKTKRRTKRPSKGPNLTLQLIKILSSLAVLVALVLCAGVLARWLIGPPAEQPNAAVRPGTRLPAPPVKSPQAPVYEVYPEGRPPAKPPTLLLPQLPGDQPPLVALIIDDIGYDRRIADQFMEMDVPLTFSMLPYAPFGRQIIEQARAQGLEIMLHLPMEPNEYPAVKPGPGALLSEMSPDELIDQLRANLDQIKGLKGVNNHMGSRISASPERMRQIFSILKKQDLYYIDSRTTAQTVARPSAQLLQLPFAERDIFIDHLDDPAFIRAQLDRLIRRAKQQGYAVGIAHPHANTYKVIKEFLPRLQESVSLVPASMVVRHAMLAESSQTNASK